MIKDQHTDLKEGDRVRIRKTVDRLAEGRTGVIVRGFAGCMCVKLDLEEEGWMIVTDHGKSIWATDVAEKI